MMHASVQEDHPMAESTEQDRMRLDVYLAEYKRLKSEQSARIGTRDNLVYASLVATAGVSAYAFLVDAGKPIVVLALPLANFVLGWIHTNNDAKSRHIARYLRYSLNERICGIVGRGPEELVGAENPCIFGWESAVRKVELRCLRKLTNLVADLVTFVVPGLLGLVFYWIRCYADYGGGVSALLGVASFIELALLGVLSAWLLEGADICWSGSDPPPRGTGRRGNRQEEAGSEGAVAYLLFRTSTPSQSRTPGLTFSMSGPKLRTSEPEFLEVRPTVPVSGHTVPLSGR
jgi:hypothetical protein